MSGTLPTFRICNEKGEEVTKKVNDYANSQSSAYFRALSGNNYNASIYFGQTLGVQIPDSCVPMVSFPSLRTDSEHYIYLTFKDSSNCYLNKITLFFKHSKGLFSPLEVDFPFPVNVNAPVVSLIYQTLSKITFASIFQRIQKKFKIPSENILITYNQNNSEYLITPSQSTLSSILQEKKADVFMNNLSLYYDIVPTLCSPTLSSFLDESLLNRLKKFEIDILRDFSPEFLSLSLPQILIRIHNEIKTVSNNQHIKDIYTKSLHFVISNVFSFMIAPILSSRYQIHPMHFFPLSWTSFISNLSEIPRQLHVLFGKDISQLVLSDFYLYGLVTCPFFIDKLFEAEKLFCSSERYSPAKSVSLAGQVLAHFTVNVGPPDRQKQFTLYLTRGFFYFYEGKTLNCALPMLSWRFVPCPSGYIAEDKPTFCTGLFVNKFISFYGTFQSQGEMIDCWILHQLCHTQLVNPEVRPLFINEMIRRLLDPPTHLADFESNELLLKLFFHYNEIIADVRIINLSWTVRFNYSQIRTLFNAFDPNPIQHTLPEHVFQNHTIPFIFGPEKKSIIVSSEHLANVIFQNDFISPDESLLSYRCALIDILHSSNTSPNQQANQLLFRILLLFKVSDYTFAMRLNSLELLKLQQQLFSSDFVAHCVHHMTILHYCCSVCKNPQIIQWVKSFYSNNDNRITRGRTGVFFAIKSHNFSAISTFKGDIDECDNNQITPLIYCFKRDMIDQAIFLLKNGARANAFGVKRSSALFWSIENKDKKAFNLLLKYVGEGINSPSNDGLFITQIAIKNQFLPFFENPPENLDPNLFSDSCPHPLHYIIQIGNSKNPIDPDKKIILLKSLLKL